MGLITGIVLLLLGVLGAAPSIILKRPDAQRYIEMLRPYQGAVGAGACLWGVWVILRTLWHLNWLSWVPLWWLTYAVDGVLLASLGFLLGYALLSQYLLSKNPNVARQSAIALARLTPYQINLGYACIALGIWTLLGGLIWGIG
jgi:hypothetical protein